MKQKLIFIYNAKGNLFSSLTDSVHKAISPKTYKCSLCLITYGSLDMKKEWKEFIEKLPYDIKFLHKDELTEKYKGFRETKLPIVLLEKNKKLKLLIKAEEINSCKTIKDLKVLVKKKLS